METNTNFPPFKEFKQSLRKRGLKDFRTESAGRQASDAEAENMRRYLLSYYRKLEASDSFMDEAGQVWDLMPADNQPFIKGRKNRSLQLAPDYPGARPEENEGPGNFPDGYTGNSGNAISRSDGLIPVRRITLESLTNFKSLDEARRKTENLLIENESSGFTSGSAEKAASTSGLELKSLDDGQHKYAYAKQLVQCKGGGSILSLWQPKVFPSKGQIFSLSQIWVVGGRDGQTQVVEAGWQVCPERWGTDRPVLFIYWTADNYQSTGHYNLEGNAFSQVNSNWKLGGTLAPVSTPGGQMFDMIFEWFFINKAWWLYLNKRAVGYYPATIFRGGVLSRFADAVVMGGEVSGNNSWAAMGSGSFPGQGVGRSAFVRNAEFMDGNGNMQHMQLTPMATAPACYRVQLVNDVNWGSAFFYGGPGGQGC